MIIKVENKNPKTIYLTVKGNRTPKIIWKDTVTGATGMRKKDVIKHNQRLEELGITSDMTGEEIKEQARKYLNGKEVLNNNETITMDEK